MFSVEADDRWSESAACLKEELRPLGLLGPQRRVCDLDVAFLGDAFRLYCFEGCRNSLWVNKIYYAFQSPRPPLCFLLISPEVSVISPRHTGTPWFTTQPNFWLYSGHPSASDWAVYSCLFWVKSGCLETTPKHGRCDPGLWLKGSAGGSVKQELK